MKYIQTYKDFETNVNETSINTYMQRLYNYLLSDKLKDKTKDFLLKCKEEIGDYKEVGQILKKASSNKTITKEDRKIVYEQLIDTLKIGSAGALFLVPFGSILIITLVKIGNKLGINFLPSAWNKTNENNVGENGDIDTYNIIKQDEISEYLKDGGDIDAVNDNGNSMLAYACVNLNYKQIKYLLEEGANVNILDSLDRNVLMDLYLSRDADLDMKIKILSLLTEYGIDWENIDKNGNMFLDNLYEVNQNVFKKVCEKFPKQYKQYLLHKDMDKFNI